MRRVLFLVVALSMTCGCNTVRIHKAKPARDAFASWRVSATTRGELSSRSRQTLRQWDLERLHDEEPLQAIGKLQKIAEQNNQPEQLFALAEMSYLLGTRTEKESNCAAMQLYYLSAGYAYHYLFHSTGAAEPFDPQFRLACDFYNAGLAKCLRAAQHVGRLDPRQTLYLQTCQGDTFALTVTHQGFRWKPEEFGQLLLCEDYQAEGLPNQHRTYGLGVPMIALRAKDAPPPGHAFYPPYVSFPVTAFFRFEGSLADLSKQRSGKLELYNPLEVQSVRVGLRKAPLETDLTTPLAYYLAQTNEKQVAVTGFLRPEKVIANAGLYFTEPYDPGKIPLLFVHGLLSSPATWATMYNDLRADPEIRKRYQFWFYFYPTYQPYLHSAADLREALARVHRDIDPNGKDPALGQMVCVGHSMGGLISRLMTIDSGDDFWKLVSSEPLEQLNATPQVKTELERVFYFARQPCVKRVVFLGTPHHGSKLSPSPPAVFVRRFIRFPSDVMSSAEALATDNPQAFPWLNPRRLPTSLDFLAPGSPALEALAGKPAPEGVVYHSVVGVAPRSSTTVLAQAVAWEYEEKGDGVVPYNSAHLQQAVSEVVVPAEHTVIHDHPLAIQEVRRILLEHAR